MDFSTPASEHEMVLAFLKGEIDSPRFGECYRTILQHLGRGRESLIDNADLDCAYDNDIRVAILGLVRGFKRNESLFRGFPDTPSWSFTVVTQDVYQRLKYANCPPWIELSSGSRIVQDAANTLKSGLPTTLSEDARDAASNIKCVAEKICAGRKYPELIAAGGTNGDLILIEGHTRATGFLMVGAESIDIFVASSPQMSHWQFY